MKENLKKQHGNKKDSFFVRRCELNKLLRNLERQLFCDRLVIDGERVFIPPHAEIMVGIKYEREHENTLTIKIQWENEKCNKKERECHNAAQWEDNECDDD